MSKARRECEKEQKQTQQYQEEIFGKGWYFLLLDYTKNEKEYHQLSFFGEKIVNIYFGKDVGEDEQKKSTRFNLTLSFNALPDIF